MVIDTTTINIVYELLARSNDYHIMVGIFGGANFHVKSDKASRISFRGFKFCGCMEPSLQAQNTASQERTESLIIANNTSLVPSPTPSFSMLHAEKWESLVRDVTCVTFRGEGWRRMIIVRG